MDTTVLQEEITNVLEKVEHWITSYQILAMLPQAIRTELIDKYGGSGEGAGHHFGAASFVAVTADNLVDVEKEYLFTRYLKVCPEPDDMKRRDAQDYVFPGNECCALFRKA